MDMYGKPLKGELATVFVMGTEQGWGDKLPENLKNGDWACVFRPKPATDSDASRPPVPTERGH